MNGSVSTLRVERVRRPLLRFWEARYGGVLGREFVLLAVMLWLYKYVRYIVKDRTTAAFENAERILHLERLLGLAFEAPMQRLILPYRDLVVGFNRYYVSFHFIGTVVFLVWAFVRSLDEYRKLRRVLVVVTLFALAIHIAFPLAPPRMMPGFVDTMARFGPNPYHSQAVESFANQYAAMPSLHVGWAIIVAYGVIRIARSPVRWLILFHPIMTCLAVTLTANHYWMDGAVAAVLVGWAIMWFCKPRFVSDRDRRDRDDTQPLLAAAG